MFIHLFGCTGSWLQPMGPSIFGAARKLLVVACGSSSLIRDQTWAPALGAQSLSHWTTREIPSLWFDDHDDAVPLEGTQSVTVMRHMLFLLYPATYEQGICIQRSTAACVRSRRFGRGATRLWPQDCFRPKLGVLLIMFYHQTM